VRALHTALTATTHHNANAIDPCDPSPA
jgi:hypothetical protein